MYVGLNANHPQFWSDTNFEFSQQIFRKSSQYQISWRYVHWGAKMFHAGGQTGQS